LEIGVVKNDPLPGERGLCLKTVEGWVEHSGLTVAKGLSTMVRRLIVIFMRIGGCWSTYSEGFHRDLSRFSVGIKSFATR
jgi:hypothetical protein